MGWSPEIAEEHGNLFYLNRGEANPSAIILTPLQQGKPVHMPFHSYDRNMMHAIFAAYGPRISDITKDSAICVDLDQYIDAFYQPFDLLRYDKITVKFMLSNQLDKVQQEQKALISEFYRENNFINEKIHTKLLESAKKYGDLRNRHLVLEPLDFFVTSFYTKAFGGVFILRDFIEPIMIFESMERFKEAIKDTSHEVLLFHMSHNELMATLNRHSIIEADYTEVVKSDRYERVKKYAMAQALDQPNHPIGEILNNDFLYKKYLNEMEPEAQKRVISLERYLAQRKMTPSINIGDYVDNQMMKALHQPHSSLTEEERELIWKLLIKIAPEDPLFLYWYDKALFYKIYETWDESFKDWAIQLILNNKNKEGYDA